MLCHKPYMVGSQECPCGRCLSCLINRRRVWAHRILLESYKHGDNCFVTLTYDDEHVPTALVKSDYQKWIRGLRKVIWPAKVRYFIAGEYGELSGRPHFHAALFGLDRVTAGGSDGRAGLVQQVWPHGFTFVGNLTWESAQYIAGYLTKKVTDHVGNRDVPEFCRMSLRPGIGALAVSDLARVLSSDVGLGSIKSSGDVPSALVHGTRTLPLGRYLRRQLRGELGFVSKDTPAEVARMYVLQKAAEKIETRAELAARGYTSWDAEKLMLDTRKQKIKNLESRFLVRDSKRSLK